MFAQQLSAELQLCLLEQQKPPLLESAEQLRTSTLVSTPWVLCF
jgi:hypothetical protein